MNVKNFPGDGVGFEAHSRACLYTDWIRSVLGGLSSFRLGSKKIDRRRFDTARGVWKVMTSAPLRLQLALALCGCEAAFIALARSWILLTDSPSIVSVFPWRPQMTDVRLKKATSGQTCQ